MQTFVIGATVSVGSCLVKRVLAGRDEVLAAICHRFHPKDFGWGANVAPVRLDVVGPLSAQAAIVGCGAAGSFGIVYGVVHTTGNHTPRPANTLVGAYHLADLDPRWAAAPHCTSGGLRGRRHHRSAWQTPAPWNHVPGLLAGALRTSLDILITLTLKVGAV